MGKRGRKPQAYAARTASGRKSRAKACLLENEEPIAVRMRMHKLMEADARDQKASTALGRLSLTREITAPQYDAGTEYLRLYEAYKRAIKAPDALRNSTGSGGDIPETESYVSWCRSVIAKHDAAMKAVQHENAILEHRGLNLTAALDYIVRRDQHFGHMVGDLRIALNVLARHFGLTGPGKSVYKGT